MLENPWWELWPGRLEYELQALEAAGIKFDRDAEAFTKHKFVQLRLHYPWNGKILILCAVFPPLYPYFRPEVFADAGVFPRHQNPIGGNLCLLGRRTENWNPDWTLADLLKNQFPRLERAALTKDQFEREALEEPIGEPMTAFYPYYANSVVAIDSAKKVGSEHNSGGLTVLVQTDSLPQIRAQVVDVCAQHGKKLYSVDGCLSHAKEIPATWIRLPEPPLVKTAQEFEKHLIDKRFIAPAKFTHKLGNWFVDIVGILLPEELKQGEMGEGWMFLVRLKQERPHKIQTELVRAGRAGRIDFDERTPELSFLHKKRVALIGLGSVGAPIAIELARSGIGEVFLIDYDFVEPGSVVRWPLGNSAFGLQKTVAVKRFIASNYPFTKATAIEYRLGIHNMQVSSADFQNALSQADLLIDATAELGIHQFLSDYARVNKRPFVYAYLTPGGYGGLVACIDSAKDMGCWHCLQIALREDKSIPEPPFLENADVQPAGCAERTSVFAGFDATEISLETTRMAIAMLSDGAKGQYPKSKWNVAIAKFRSPEGESLPPCWNTYFLNRNPRCPVCK
jgi:molybdopterin/thiamine biosynthesis adenylyltransferase/ubiquitin-protein ligase